MKARIIIEISGPFAQEEAENKINEVSQIFMRRNPIEEPHIYIEIIDDPNISLFDDIKGLRLAKTDEEKKGWENINVKK